MRSFLRALAGCLLVTANAHAAEVKSPDFTSVDLQDKALVLLSTSADHTPRMAIGSSHLMLVRVDQKKNKRKLTSLGSIHLDNPFTASHSPAGHMNVHWRALEPGEYFLKQTLTSPTVCFEVRVIFHFTVTAGMKVYLGEFALRSNELGIRDAYQRDYDYFVAHSKGEKPAEFTPGFPERQVVDAFGCRPMSPY